VHVEVAERLSDVAAALDRARELVRGAPRLLW
jgi:hypothetical protein